MSNLKPRRKRYLGPHEKERLRMTLSFELDEQKSPAIKLMLEEEM